MKKFFVCLAVLATISVAFSSNIFAQTKGTKYFKGGIGFSYSEDSAGTTSWGVALAPEYGVFVKDNLSVGGFVVLESDHNKVEFFGESIESNDFYAVLGGTATYNLRIANWFYYTPGVYAGIIPYMSLGGDHVDTLMFWGRADLVAFDFRFKEKFALNLGLLNYQH